MSGFPARAFWRSGPTPDPGRCRSRRRAQTAARRAWPRSRRGAARGAGRMGAGALDRTTFSSRRRTRRRDAVPLPQLRGARRSWVASASSIPISVLLFARSRLAGICVGCCPIYLPQQLDVQPASAKSPMLSSGRATRCDEEGVKSKQPPRTTRSTSVSRSSPACGTRPDSDALGDLRDQAT